MKKLLNFRTSAVVFGLLTVLLIFSGEIELFFFAFFTIVLAAVSIIAAISKALAKKHLKDGFLIFTAFMAVIVALTVAFGIYDLSTADSEVLLDGIVGSWLLEYSLPVEIITIVTALIARAVKKKKSK